MLEAEITGGLEHPGIVPVYALGCEPGGEPFYAMRFIRGESLKQVIERFHAAEGTGATQPSAPAQETGVQTGNGRKASSSSADDPGRRLLEFRKLLRRFTDVCNAMDYAHSRGVLHRDIKPSNIVVGKHGETLVVDWGLAKAVGRAEPGVGPADGPLIPSSASGSAETLPGSIMGTPAYMSPEQAAGDLDRLGPASDVYSLGATLYGVLTGAPPFEGSAEEVLRAVQKGEFRPPRAVNPAVDPALDAICSKAMSLQPEHRYPSCRRWPRTSSAGPRMNRCRRGASPSRGARAGGRGATEPALPPRSSPWWRA